MYLVLFFASSHPQQVIWKYRYLNCSTRDFYDVTTPIFIIYARNSKTTSSSNMKTCPRDALRVHSSFFGYSSNIDATQIQILLYLYLTTVMSVPDICPFLYHHCIQQVYGVLFSYFGRPIPIYHVEVPIFFDEGGGSTRFFCGIFSGPARHNRSQTAPQYYTGLLILENFKIVKGDGIFQILLYLDGNFPTSNFSSNQTDSIIIDE